MKKVLRKSLILLAAALGCANSTTSAESNTPNDTRLLIRQRTYGDVLGESSNKCTAEKVYYYNNKLQLRRILNTKPGTNNNIFETQDYFTYEYENNLLTEVAQWQYGLYDHGQWTMKKSNTGNITYEYDTNGNCILENNDGVITKREYDAQGHCTKLIEGSGRTTTYDKFTADGKPEHSFTRPARPQNLGDSYETTYTYDANGNLIQTYSAHDEDLTYGTSIFDRDEVYAGDPVSKETWTYTNGILTEHMTYGIDYTYSFSDGLCPASKTVYSMIDNNPNIIRYYTLEYDPWGSGWSTKATVEFEDEYQDFSDYKDLENEIVSATQSESETNAALIEFTLPERIKTDSGIGFNIYRNGIFVRSFYLENMADYDNLIYNEDRETLTYIDRQLMNGKYEYFVETIRSEKGENNNTGDGLDGDLGGMVTPNKYVPSYIVSNLANVTINTDLPTATNLRAEYIQGDTQVTIHFDAPQNAEAYGFIKNELYVDGGQLAESESSDITVTSLNCEIFDGSHTVYILTRYTYGYAISEFLTVNTSVPTAIKEVNASNETAKVYDLQGRMASKLNNGIYIIVKNGKAQKVLLSR